MGPRINQKLYYHNEYNISETKYWKQYDSISWTLFLSNLICFYHTQNHMGHTMYWTTTRFRKWPIAVYNISFLWLRICNTQKVHKYGTFHSQNSISLIRVGGQTLHASPKISHANPLFVKSAAILSIWKISIYFFH